VSNSQPSNDKKWFGRHKLISPAEKVDHALAQNASKLRLGAAAEAEAPAKEQAKHNYVTIGYVRKYAATNSSR
jgi:hypothetical protein